MDEFANILHRDYGLKPQGKSAPMTASKPAGPSPFSPSSTPSSIHRTSSGGKPKNGSNRNSRSSTPILGESLDENFFFASLNGVNSSSSGHNTYGSAAPDMPAMYDDVFGGPPKFAAPSYPPMPSSATQQTSSSQSYDDIFRIPAKTPSSTSSSSNRGSSLPVFDAPVYDDDIFGGVPGIRSASVVYDDVFSGGSTVGTSPSVLEDLLGVSENRDRPSRSQQPAIDTSTPAAGVSDFDDLIPGFGGTEPAKPRSTGGGKSSQYNSSGLEKNYYGMPSSDPFDVVQGEDPFNVPQSADQASTSPFSDSDASKVPVQSSGTHRGHHSNSDFGENMDASGNGSPHISTDQSPMHDSNHPAKSKNSSLNSAQTYDSVLEENHFKRNQSSSNQADDQTRSSSSPKPPYGERTEIKSFHSPVRRNRQIYDDVDDPVRVPKVVEKRQVDEFWISVEDVKLVTEPTSAPPPSRRPPLPGLKHSHSSRRAAGSKTDSNQLPTSRHESPQSAKLSSSRQASEHSNRSNLNDSGSLYDDLEEFASGVSRARKETKMDMSAATLEEEIMEGSAAAAASAMAMKEAMERARSKLKDREKEERESSSKVETQEDVDIAKEDEEKAREREEKERAREREDREKETKALREREEREKRRREREEIERKREREKDRIAVERATQEARERAERVAVERANAEARERAAAEARQRAAVERATAEARERAAAEARERAAVERVTAEARERAAVEARERAAAEAREKAAAEAREKAAAERAAVERAAAEARERAAAEAREKAVAERAASEARARAERAFVERVNAEARERAAEKAAADARERAERAATERASAAREQQRRSENDLEAFFAASSRPSSAPRQRSPAKSTSSQPSKGFAAEASQRSSTAAPAAKKVAPTSSADDWMSIFGPAVPAAGEFQEFEGESTERRKARLERHQRTAERAAKALDEKNQRDLQAQREQAERHRAGEMLDTEIKRWAAGKEGNLRALLSTLQYVLWPECGWQAVSLTDLITAAAVKKVYRKATLCVHPDKVQQKGATIQQKYIAEKVFDLLKEAWNKFNSEELF